MSGKAVGSIRLVLAFLRDGVEDTLEHHYSKAYSINDPLPTLEELNTASLYVRYVPKEKSSKNIPDWVMVSNNDKHDGVYGRSGFNWMIKFLIPGTLLMVYSTISKKKAKALQL